MDIRAFRMEAWEMMSVMMDAEIPRVLRNGGVSSRAVRLFLQFPLYLYRERHGNRGTVLKAWHKAIP